MKKLSFILAILLLTPLAASAQKSSESSLSKRPEISFGYAGFPMVGGYFFHYNGTSWFRDFDPVPPTIDTIYGDEVGSTHSIGTAVLTVDIPILKWLSIPVSATASMNMTPVTGAFDAKSHMVYDYAFNLLAGARFKYMNKEHINLYSTLQAGLCVYNLPKDAFNNNGADHLFPALQLVPIGIRAGGRLYGFAELGLGTLYFGGQIGIGFKL